MHPLQIPYEIGQFIASQIPFLDEEVAGTPWACHTLPFSQGPDPRSSQLAQGILLRVLDHNHLPDSLYTRYGKWVVLGACRGQFKNIFDLLEKTLELELVETYSHSTRWAVRAWKGQKIPEPFYASEILPAENVIKAYESFKQQYSLTE